VQLCWNTEAHGGRKGRSGADAMRPGKRPTGPATPSALARTGYRSKVPRIGESSGGTGFQEVSPGIPAKESGAEERGALQRLRNH
jgi:hypothetical protein